jgi:hypothetical protein
LRWYKNSCRRNLTLNHLIDYPHERRKSIKDRQKIKERRRREHLARWHGSGFYELQTEDIGDVPVRLFLTQQLLNDAEEILYQQIVNATRFPGVRVVVITPDAHYGCLGQPATTIRSIFQIKILFPD